MKGITMDKHNKYEYAATVSYSAEDEGYIARFAAFENCIGFGEKPEQAVHEAYEGLEGILEVMQRKEMPLPDPDTMAQRLKQLKPLIKITTLAKRAGLNPSTLATKMERGGPFSEDERGRIERVLCI